MSKRCKQGKACLSPSLKICISKLKWADLLADTVRIENHNQKEMWLLFTRIIRHFLFLNSTRHTPHSPPPRPQPLPSNFAITIIVFKCSPHECTFLKAFLSIWGAKSVYYEVSKKSFDSQGGREGRRLAQKKLTMCSYMQTGQELPKHFFPSPEYPRLQVQLYDEPTIFWQTALTSQLWWLVMHSSMTERN